MTSQGVGHEHTSWKLYRRRYNTAGTIRARHGLHIGKSAHVLLATPPGRCRSWTRTQVKGVSRAIAGYGLTMLA